MMYDITDSLQRRKLGLKHIIDISYVVDEFKYSGTLKLREDDEEFELIPDDYLRRQGGPLASTKITSDILAIGCEDGSIYLLDIKKFKKLKHWDAIDNAIFDLTTRPNTQNLLTASGDSTIRLWDIESQKNTLIFSPHYSSIKSVSFYDSNTLCSGSRDGTIKVHDLRLQEPTIVVIPDAHKNMTYSKRRTRKLELKTDPTSCVTSTTFDPYIPRIYSAGANDAAIKIWDLRKLRRVKRGRGPLATFQPAHKISHPIKGVNCGYSQLLFSNCKLYAGCSDHKIYSYSNLMSNEEPLVYAGFYYKPYFRLATLENRLLLSGSGNGGAMLWSLDPKRPGDYTLGGARKPFKVLENNNSMARETALIETTSDPCSIYTFSDDFQISKWNLG